jgi:ABC-type antimicrobial peptide transport system permease subunit
VAVVNERLAKQYFGDASPVGRRIRLPGNEPELREIVGVVGDAMHFGARGRVWPQVYLPGAMPGSLLVVRSTADVRVLGELIRESVQAVDSSAQVERVQHFDALLERSFSRERLIATLSTGFAILAVALAAIGLYGITAYGLARRTHELGLRMALGARRGHILWLVLRETLQIFVLGSAAGIAGALASTQFVSSLLYGVKPTDLFAFLGAIVLLIAVALTAAFLPARRASRIDPMRALRCD